MSDITSQQLVVFSLGAEEYALPIAAVHEIIRFTEPRSVASDVAWVRGVIGLRGKIIPIFDLAARLGLAGAGTEPGQDRDRRDGHRPGRRHGRRGRGGPDRRRSDQLETVPTANADFIEAIAKIDDRLVILLNPEGLFAHAGALRRAAPRPEPR